MNTSEQNWSEVFRQVGSLLDHLHVDDIAFHRREGRVLLEMGGILDGPNPKEGEQESGNSIRATKENGCAGDLLKILRREGRRLTVRDFLDFNERLPEPWSETAIRHALTTMADIGVLSRGPRRGGGFGFPEWED